MQVLDGLDTTCGKTPIKWNRGQLTHDDVHVEKVRVHKTIVAPSVIPASKQLYLLPSLLPSINFSCGRVVLENVLVCRVITVLQLEHIDTLYKWPAIKSSCSCHCSSFKGLSDNLQWQWFHLFCITAIFFIDVVISLLIWQQQLYCCRK